MRKHEMHLMTAYVTHRMSAYNYAFNVLKIEQTRYEPKIYIALLKIDNKKHLPPPCA